MQEIKSYLFSETIKEISRLLDWMVGKEIVSWEKYQFRDKCHTFVCRVNSEEDVLKASTAVHGAIRQAIHLYFSGRTDHILFAYDRISYAVAVLGDDNVIHAMSTNALIEEKYSKYIPWFELN